MIQADQPMKGKILRALFRTPSESGVQGIFQVFLCNVFSVNIGSLQILNLHNVCNVLECSIILLFTTFSVLNTKLLWTNIGQQ